MQWSHLRRGDPRHEHVLGQPALGPGHGAAQPQGEALLAQQRVAAVPVQYSTVQYSTELPPYPEPKLNISRVSGLWAISSEAGLHGHPTWTLELVTASWSYLELVNAT